MACGGAYDGVCDGSCGGAYDVACGRASGGDCGGVSDGTYGRDSWRRNEAHVNPIVISEILPPRLSFHFDGAADFEYLICCIVLPMISTLTSQSQHAVSNVSP